MITRTFSLASSRRAALTLLAAMLTLGGPLVRGVHAQQAVFDALNPAGTKIQVLPVRGSIFMLVGAGGNITASVGPDGVLLVDTGLAQSSDEVLGAIRRIQTFLQASGALAVMPIVRGAAEARSRMPWHPNMNFNSGPPKPIRYIINTHVHPDHTGGNEKIATMGVTYAGGNVAGTIADAAQGAEVLAHESVLERMVSAKPAMPFGMLPTMTYFTPDMKLSTFFNGEGVRLVHMPAAHTGGDTIVYFRGADVISAGDIVSMSSYPVIDVAKGGSIDGIITALNYILNLAIPEFRTEGGTMIIPGHGRLVDSADVGYYRDMLTIIRDRIRGLVEEGKTLEEVKAAKPTFGYDGRFGATSGFWTTEKFVEAAYQSLSRTANEAQQVQ